MPAKMNFGGYAKVFTDSRIWVGYRNTIFYSVAGTALNMLVTIPAAFALSRREFKPRRVILFLMTFTMFFSGGMIRASCCTSSWSAELGVGVHPSGRGERVEPDRGAFVLRELDPGEPA
nr:hypothetical protein [Bifidobacterium longum]